MEMETAALPNNGPHPIAAAVPHQTRLTAAGGFAYPAGYLWQRVLRINS